ncbi:MAG: aspartate kinase [Bacteroidales bacterium]|jgi:aspartate kinase|nr:aspartate kinase [Bacteroidales bacterium]
MPQKVFKFGGASVKNADAVKNLLQILLRFSDDKLVLVFSAMGKTTNALEELLQASRAEQKELKNVLLEQLKAFHFNLAAELFPPESLKPLTQKLELLFEQLNTDLKMITLDYDQHYDATVGYGELFSTEIISYYMMQNGISAKLIDAREIILTDNCFRAANVNWEKSCESIQKRAAANRDCRFLITQGFIGGTLTHETTTLGREGSDYSAAIIAYCLGATEVIIWKDVPGLLNADPKRLTHTKKIDHISYAEAIELAYYGATVIHPKTIKPLQNGKIRLKVQSFLNPDLAPSLIDYGDENIRPVPSFIIKEQQILMSISARDLSFMNEDILHKLFGYFVETRIHINVMQTSALSLSVCFDEDSQKLENLINGLEAEFSIRYNSRLTLFTIRHYNQKLADAITSKHEILLEQRSRTTLQIVVKSLDIPLIDAALRDK